MKVKAVKSHRKDNFTRLSASLVRELERTSIDPFQYIYSFSHDGKMAYLWPFPETNLSNDLAIEAPEIEGDGDLKWISKSLLNPARRALVKPMSWKDQMLCTEHSDLLASSLILEQVRLIWPGAIIEVHLAQGKISLQVISSEPRSDSALMLVQDTELEIEQPHIEPRVKQKSEKSSLFSIVADPSVEHGFAMFCLSDLIDQGWKTYSSKVYFKIESLKPSIRMENPEFGLVGKAGPGKRVKKGTIHVHPSLFENGLLNTSFIKLSVVDVSAVQVTKGISFKVSIDHEDDGTHSYLDEFKCESAQYILPSQLKKSNLISDTRGPDLFVKMDKSTQVQLDFSLPPVHVQVNHVHPKENELRQILESMEPGLILVKGESGSGKSSLAKSLTDKHGSIRFDFDSLLNNVGQTHLRLAEIRDSLEIVPKTTPLLFDHIEWILAPANLESIHEDERWTLENLCKVFMEVLEEVLRSGRRIVIFVQEHCKNFDILATEALVLTRIETSKNTPIVSEKPQISWEEFKGNSTAKATLEEAIIWPIKWSALFKANKFAQFSAVLLHGPTGCGKTALMNSITSALPGVHVIRVRGPELLSKYIGSSEEAVRNVFQEARQHRPSLILMDEIDSLAPRRGHDNTGVTDRVVNQLLTEIDGTGDRGGIFIVGTTSRKDLIDPALLRSGRIDIHIPILMPVVEERKKIIEYLIGFSDGHTEEFAKRTEGMSPAQIKSLLYDAQLDAASGTINTIRIALENLSIAPQGTVTQDARPTKLKATLA